MRYARRIVFLLLAAVYLVSCPLVLLQAFGYSLKPGAEQGIVRTGLISLATTPPGATVYLGKRRYTNTTPAVLRGLLPGSYDVRLNLPGYQPWARTVTVEAEKSAVFEHILLLPAAWTRERLLSGSFQELLPLPGTKWLLLRRGPTLSEHLFYDWKTGAAMRLAAADSPLAETRVLSLSTVTGSPALLVRLGVPADEWAVWIEPSSEEPRLEDLTGLLPPSARRVTWDPLDRRHLLFLQDGMLVRLHLPSRTVTPLMAGVQGFGLFERTLYVLDEHHALFQADLEGKGKRPLLEGPAWAGALASEHRPLEIKAFSKEAILALGGRGELFAPRAPDALIEQGALGLAWDPHHQRAVVWKKDRLGIVEWGDPPEHFPHLQWVFENGRRITQAFWVHQGSHLLVHDDDAVLLLELDRAGSPAVHTLFPVRPGSAVAYDDESGGLSYLEPSAGALCSTVLLPRRDLLGFSFPERTDLALADPR